MSFIDKLLSKVNKAKSALNSVKGIESKIKSLNFNSVIDQLGEQAREARESLEERRSSLESQISSSTQNKGFAKANPATSFTDLQYPLEDLDNWIVFTTRPRKKRGGGRNANLLSDNNQVEIKLYVPDGLLSQANVTYNAKGQSAAIQAIADVIEGFGENGLSAESFENMGTEAMSAIKSVGNKMADSITGGLTNLTQGRAVNPMQEQMLDGIGFRSFNFTYEFYPKSQKEAEMMNNIIFSFRTAMLPDTFAPQDGGDIENFFNYPNIFDVEFEGPISEKVDGFLPMVCSKCDVDHTGGQKFSTFVDGQPIKTTLTMEFLEIKILSQENYVQISPFAEQFRGEISGGTSVLEESTGGGG
jgi:hypothetical protein